MLARPSRRRTKAVFLLVPIIGVTLVFWRIQEGINLVIPEVAREGIPKCTKQQLKAINTALPDLDHRCSDDKYPWQNKCPISKITGCPEQTWLDQYYQYDYRGTGFTAVNIGCNKGFDAVNLLRMGSNDETITRSKWNESMPQNMQPSNCQQDREESQYQIIEGSTIRKAQVYCIEPLSATFVALQDAAQKTSYHRRGLHVFQYAVNNDHDVNFTMFPKAPHSQNGTTLLGAEKEGGGNCYSRRPTRQARLQQLCEPVPTTRLDNFVQNQGLLRNRIDVLLIDVEGWDYEVLKGGRYTLQHTAYLEFEYNWRGPWKQEKKEKPLLQAISMLNEMHFTCYWPGRDQLWRITGCWLQHYEGLFWSNVVCVNRILAPTLAERMENAFLATIGAP